MELLICVRPMECILDCNKDKGAFLFAGAYLPGHQSIHQQKFSTLDQKESIGYSPVLCYYSATETCLFPNQRQKGSRSRY